MDKANVEQVAQKVYGPESQVVTQAAGPNLFQAGVVVNGAVVLAVVTANTEEAALKALGAALEALLS